MFLYAAEPREFLFPKTPLQLLGPTLFHKLRPRDEFYHFLLSRSEAKN